MTTKPVIGNFSSVGDAAWTKSDGTSIGSVNATTGAWVFGQGGSTALFSNVLSIHANNTVAGPGRGIAVSFNETNAPITLSVAQSNGFPYLGFNTNQTAGTDGQTYAVNSGAARIDYTNGLNFKVADGGTAGNAITYVNSGSVSPTGAWTFGPASSGHNIFSEGTTTSSHVAYFYSNASTSGNCVRAYQDGAGATGSAIYSYSDGTGDTTVSITNNASAYAFGAVNSTVASQSNNTKYMRFTGVSGGDDGYIQTNGSAVLSLVDVSDQRLKTNIREPSYGLSTIMSLHPVEFDWITGPSDVKGFIAQEVLPILPESVSIADQSANGGLSDTHTLETHTMVPILVKAIQELKAELDAAKSRITQLEGN